MEEIFYVFDIFSAFFVKKNLDLNGTKYDKNLFLADALIEAIKASIFLVIHLMSAPLGLNWRTAMPPKLALGKKTHFLTDDVMNKE